MESYLWDWQLGGHQQPPGLTSYVKARILYLGYQMQRWKWMGGRKTKEGHCSVTGTEYKEKGKGLYLGVTLCFLLV